MAAGPEASQISAAMASPIRRWLVSAAVQTPSMSQNRVRNAAPSGMTLAAQKIKAVTYPAPSDRRRSERGGFGGGQSFTVYILVPGDATSASNSLIVGCVDSGP